MMKKINVNNGVTLKKKRLYLAFRYFSGRNTTTGEPNPRTGFYSNAGSLCGFYSIADRRDWIFEERLSKPCGLGGGERIPVTIKEARSLLLGESLEDFYHEIERIRDELEEEIEEDYLNE